MDLTLLLPWFPILLAVGIGGRLLGRPRSVFLGFVCALFWVALVQASAGYAVWHEPWTIAALVCGCVAIAAMGAWSGDTPVEFLSVQRPSTETPTDIAAAPRTGDAEREASFERLATAMAQFDDWLEESRNDESPWPKFGDFVRSVIHQCCDATHVKPYRLLNEGEELAPLRRVVDLGEDDCVPARRGIVGHVVTTGRRYLAGDASQGEHVLQLAAEHDENLAWAFAVRQGPRRLGIVTVGLLGVAPEQNAPLLRAVERMINQFWNMLDEALRGRFAVQNDPVSGLPTRPAFLRTAEQSLRQSYTQGEPVAVAVMAIEGLRELSDSGRWGVADDLAKEVSEILRRKVRLDDRLGRFDDSMFIVLLRRVDSELGSLIVAQLQSRLTTLCEDVARWRAPVRIRCGLAGSGTERPDLNTLVFRAISECHRARDCDTAIANDLDRTPAAMGDAV